MWSLFTMSYHSRPTREPSGHRTGTAKGKAKLSVRTASEARSAGSGRSHGIEAMGSKRRDQGTGLGDRPPTPTLGRMVEPDGIEPTTSCLQSTRSPN